MKKKTSLTKFTSDTPSMGDYNKEADTITYTKTAANKTSYKVGSNFELFSAYCRSGSPCKVNIEVDVGRIANRKSLFTLNQKRRKS